MPRGVMFYPEVVEANGRQFEPFVGVPHERMPISLGTLTVYGRSGLGQVFSVRGCSDKLVSPGRTFVFVFVPTHE